MGFSKQEYWNSFPFPSPGNFSKTGKKPTSLMSFALAGVLFTTQFNSVQSLSCIWIFVTPWIAAGQASLSITNSGSPHKPMSFVSVMPSNHFILCHSVLLLLSIFPSIRVFSSESVLRIRWPQHWSFSFSISPSNHYAGLISFRIDWFDLLAVQVTLKSFFPTPQFKSMNSLALSFLHRPALTSIHDHWKNNSLDYTDLCWLLNMLSRLVITSFQGVSIF